MDFKELTKKFLNKKKPLKKNGFLVDPDVYWKFVLFFTAAVIVGFFAFGFYLLNQVNKDDDNTEPVNVVRIKTINTEKFEKVIEHFSKREQAAKNIKNFPSPVIDPSL